MVSSRSVIATYKCSVAMIVVCFSKIQQERHSSLVPWARKTKLPV